MKPRKQKEIQIVVLIPLLLLIGMVVEGNYITNNFESSVVTLAARWNAAQPGEQNNRFHLPKQQKSFILTFR